MKIVELEEHEIRQLLKLISIKEKVELVFESGCLANDRWWRERDERLHRIDGDLLRVFIDLDGMEQRLKEAT